MTCRSCSVSAAGRSSIWLLSGVRKANDAATSEQAGQQTEHQHDNGDGHDGPQDDHQDTTATGKVEDFTERMFAAINGMMLDMLAAIARKDYEDRRRRQMQGQEKAKAEGKYVGRPENKRRNARIAAMLASGTSYSDVARTRMQPRYRREDRQAP
jgi:hypothetical protein